MSTGSATGIITRAEQVSAKLARPEHFTDHKHCCECREHDGELQPYTPGNIPRSALGTMAWDPITFCTDEAFRYFLPGLIRIVLTEDGEGNYYEQFLWHVNAVPGGHDRYAICSREEREVVAMALTWLLDNRSEEIEQECSAQLLLHALERWSGQEKCSTSH